MNEIAIPQPGVDLIPDGWCQSTVMPWADEQIEQIELRHAAAQVDALIAAYATMNADTLELTRARRYLEIRWGELLGPGKRGQPGHEELANSHASEIGRMDRTRFRQLAVNRDSAVDRILKATDADQISRSKLIKEVRAEERNRDRAERSERTEALDLGDRYSSCVSSAADLDCGEVDMIITDPPYPREFLPTFADLSKTAARLLRPGGLCVVMSGQSYLPTVMAHLGEALDYYWVGAYMTPGDKANLRQRNVLTGWKPLLVYSNGPTNPKMFYDVTTSDRNDKDWHHWGQSVSGMLDIVERMTEPGDLILDPFAGGGSTAIAALELNRRVIVSDEDEEQIRICDRRVSEWYESVQANET